MTARDHILARVYVVLTLLALLPVLVAWQVLRIYLAEGTELRAQGEQQASTTVSIPAMRGAILDRAGRVLAVNTARYDLAADPTVRGFRAAQETFFERLSKLTGRPAAEYRRRVQNRASRQYVLLERGLGEAQKETIDTWDVPGLLTHATFGRRYNYGSTAAHVLGHTDADLIGIAGTEMQADAYLRGEAGRRAVKRDRHGNVKAYVGGHVVEPRHGQNVVLTIDLIRQTVLEEELARGVAEAGAAWGAAVAMDPHTGAILALANAPTYDPNRPGAAAAETRRNRAITDRLEPGSTFKLVSAVAALEAGVVAINDTIDTGAGWAVFGGRTMRDTHAHGRIPFSEVIVQSSNVGVAKTAAKMKPGTLYQYARRFGFGQPTWVDLPGEVSGTLKRPDRWSGTTLTSMSIGYEVDVTPLQMLAAYAALANGGLLVQPYVVAERRDITGRVLWSAPRDSIRRVFAPETAAALRPVFEQVVSEGTAKRASVEGLAVAGKTGTARSAAGGSYSGSYRATFVGFFPADDPQVALIVVLGDPKTSIYGGSVAAPVFGRVADRWIGTFPAIAARVAPADTLPAPTKRPVPPVVGRPAAVAADLLAAAGFRPVGDVAPDDDATPAALVEAQAPAADAPASLGARVRAEADTTTADRMPDLTGLSARHATFWLAARGIEATVEGSGMVASQSPAAGAALPARAVLRCR